MSAEPASAPCELLEWDSAFFGLRIGRVRAPGLAGRLDRVLAWTRERRIDCLYGLVDASDIESIRAAEDGGFRLCDVRVTLETDLSERRARPLDPLPEGLAHFEPADLTALCAIARSSHRDSRFYNDPHFPRERCDDLYETWLRRACEGRSAAVLVVRQEGQAVGYACNDLLADGNGQIALTAVAGHARARGMGQLLWETSLDWMVHQGCPHGRVVTQARNVRALRLYEKVGFLTTRVEHWYHLWPADSPRGVR